MAKVEIRGVTCYVILHAEVYAKISVICEPDNTQ